MLIVHVISRIEVENKYIPVSDLAILNVLNERITTMNLDFQYNVATNQLYSLRAKFCFPRSTKHLEKTWKEYDC